MPAQRKRPERSPKAPAPTDIVSVVPVEGGGAWEWVRYAGTGRTAGRAVSKSEPARWIRLKDALVDAGRKNGDLPPAQIVIEG